VNAHVRLSLVLVLLLAAAGCAATPAPHDSSLPRAYRERAVALDPMPGEDVAYHPAPTDPGRPRGRSLY